jgi:hypothetical protein
MNIRTESYLQSVERLPKNGQHILGYQQDDLIIVYQAYNNRIADYAVKNQQFGGDYSFSRMSWIKPNFLWMMYRCGWASKDVNQERVLALWIEKSFFEKILSEAVISSFNSEFYVSQEEWKKDLEKKDVRLQWDPDHDPYGQKLERRAIQLGLKGNILEDFGKKQLKRVEDITDFVKEQKKFVEAQQLENLIVPVETVWLPEDRKLGKRIGISA